MACNNWKILILYHRNWISFDYFFHISSGQHLKKSSSSTTCVRSKTVVRKVFNRSLTQVLFDFQKKSLQKGDSTISACSSFPQSTTDSKNDIQSLVQTSFIFFNTVTDSRTQTTSHSFSDCSIFLSSHLILFLLELTLSSLCRTQFWNTRGRCRWCFLNPSLALMTIPAGLRRLHLSASKGCSPNWTHYPVNWSFTGTKS